MRIGNSVLWKKSLWMASIFVMILLFSFVSTKTVIASEKMTLEDFYYYLESGNEWSFLESDGDDGRISHMNKGEKTHRGIKISDGAKKVMSKYGTTKKKVFNQSDSFNKYLNYYKERYDLDTDGWKYYLEYGYKKGSKNDRRLRFYLNKKNKVVDILYIYKYKVFKMNKNTVDLDLTFASESGKIKEKKIGGQVVSMIPQDAVVNYSEKNLSKDSMGYSYGVNFYIEQISTKGKVQSFTYIPMGLFQMKSGSDLSKILNENMWYLKKGDLNMSHTDTKKLGKYKYFKLTVWDVDSDDGYDIPAIYYFKY